MIIKRETHKVSPPPYPAALLDSQGNQIYDNALFLDLEHFIDKVPICIGVFGVATYEEGALHSVQYMIENKKDAEALLVIMRDFFKADRHRYLVTFAGGNDINVIHHLFSEAGFPIDLTKQYISVDLQKFYHDYTHEPIGLKPLEKIFEIERDEEELISGRALARTFQHMVKDEHYAARMPAGKMDLILHYNLSDVVNLFHILVQWHLYVSYKPRTEKNKKSEPND